MAAGGVLINWDGLANMAYLLISPTGSDRFAMTTEDFTITWWSRFNGPVGIGGEGHRCLYLQASSGDWIHIYSNPANAASPRNFYLQKVNFGTNPITSAVSIADSTDMFFGVTWNHTTGEMTLYTCVDQGTLASTSWTEATTYTIDELRSGARSSDPTVSDYHYRNLKIWKTLHNSTAIDAERHSEAPVSSTNLVGDYRLLNASSLTNTYGGSGAWPSATLVQNGTGTVTDGSMDPVDLQGGAASPIWVPWS